MNNLISIFTYELNRNIRRRAFLFSTFGLPLIAAVFIFGIQAFTGNDSANPQDQFLQFDTEGISVAGYVDFSGEFADPGELAAEIAIPYADEAAVQAALDAGEITVYYVIPQDFLETGEVTMYAPRFNIGTLTSAPVEQLFYSQFVNELSDVDITVLQRLVQPVQVEAFDLTETDEAAEDVDQDSTVAQVFAIMFFLAIFGANGYLMQSVIEEKETRLVEILISSVRPLQLLGGKILAMGVLGLIQLVAYLGTFFIVSNIATGSNPLEGVTIEPTLLFWAFVYFVLGYLLFAAAFGAIGAISTSLSEGPSISVVVVLPAILPWILAPVIVEDPNGTAATLMSLIPMMSPLGMIVRLTVTDIPIVEIALSISILIVSIIGMMWFAGRLFRVNTLLSGKVPGLRDIPQLLRG